jgi:ketosteroid isomerase-like protein
VLLAVGIIACGDSDDDKEKPAARATTLPTGAGGSEVVQPPAEPVDFAAEEAAILQLLKEHDNGFNRKDIDEILGYWADKGVFMAHNFFGVVKRVDGRGKIRLFWTDFWKKIRTAKMQATIDKVGINSRGQKATAHGIVSFIGKKDFAASLEKNAEGAWKIKAVDYGDSNFIKKIITPRIN